jgi:hypothetical protein
MSQTYPIPPGCEDTWTHPDNVVIAPVENNNNAITAIRMVRVHAVVRGQDQAKILARVDKLEALWQAYLNNPTSKETIDTQLINFRNQDLCDVLPSEIDEITTQAFEAALMKAFSEVK